MPSFCGETGPSGVSNWTIAILMTNSQRTPSPATEAENGSSTAERRAALSSVRWPCCPSCSDPAKKASPPKSSCPLGGWAVFWLDHGRRAAAIAVGLPPALGGSEGLPWGVVPNAAAVRIVLADNGQGRSGVGAWENFPRGASPWVDPKADVTMFVTLI